MPDFYSLLKEKRIVIMGDYPMAKGDWVLICQEPDAVALAKIGSVPVPSTVRAYIIGTMNTTNRSVGTLDYAGRPLHPPRLYRRGRAKTKHTS